MLGSIRYRGSSEQSLRVKLQLQLQLYLELRFKWDQLVGSLWDATVGRFSKVSKCKAAITSELAAEEVKE